MEIQTQGLDDYIAILKRRKWQLIVPAALLFAVAAFVALAIKPVYRSSATILIEQQEIPSDLVRSTVTSYADQRVQTISQRVMTMENLGKIVKSHNLYPDLMSQLGLSSAVEQIREDLHLEMISVEVVDPRTRRPAEVTIAFSLAFESDSPVQAKKVADDVTTLFLNENIKDRREAARDASDFLEKESKKLADQVSTLEATLAHFKEEHGDSLPELMTLNLQLMQSTEERLRDNAQSIRALEERKIYLESELAQLDTHTKLYSDTGERVLSAADRLRALEAEYVSLAANYSKSYPSRARVERELEALRREVGRSSTARLDRRLTEQRGELAAQRERYSAEHPDVKKLERAIAVTREQIRKAREEGKANDNYAEDADNPAYVQLQAQLSATDSELGSLKETAVELRAKLADFESRIANSPKIEREYLTLTRDYDNAMAAYGEVKNKQMEAELAEALETESKGERFSLIEPPLLPERPDKPNRLAILLVGFVFAVGGGVGNLAMREAIDTSIYSAGEVQSITGAPPLAVIPYIQTNADRIRRRIWTLVILSGLLLAVILALRAVDLFVMPLEDLGLKLLQKFGLGEAGTE